MFDFSKVQSPRAITTEWILSRISDTEILGYYFGRFEIGRVYCARHRKDNKPSISFFVRNGKVFLKDFATGESFNCFSYVQKITGLSFNKTLEMIASDFGLIDRKTLTVPDQVFKEASLVNKEVIKETKIQFVPNSWNKENLLFWRVYEIYEEELSRERIFPVKKLFINNKEIRNYENHLRYAFVEPDIGVKIYSPYDKNMKWLSNIPLDTPFGLKDLSYKSDTIIISKAKKDLVILKKFFTDVIATQNESESSLPEELQKHLLEKYNKRIIIWDSDDVGVENCKKFNEKGFGYFNIPKVEYQTKGIKDISDYVEWYGLDELKYLFIKKQLL